ncbi:hypothetical protein [Ornithinimicrobium tianjinense]|uniref:Uncharacterized protein n=1 Tax=Ornithinimicrobium tianjinense TaxID=1195761 RepID=A0A917BH27_9MICO|nr:hypothetical protein [Ornithinimicrobium tianjinense]GGF43741.1 hypothetical protein GCM10011366_09400 [Ornithinimicrobium tianjinense]
MYGPRILTRFLERPGPEDSAGLRWQYHSRSDRHSKVGSWGVALDLLATSSLLRAHADEGKVVLGVNHTMRDFATGRKKDLDLVVARPGADATGRARSLRSLVDEYQIPLTPEEEGTLHALPDIHVAPVGAVLIALEAKACMTAHVKALPRLYDELNSSHLCVHGASSQALAIAYVQVNHADQFISSNPKNVLLRSHGAEPERTQHRQPDDTLRVLDKLTEIPRRSSNSGHGFDAIGVSVLELANDGSPVRLVEQSPAPQSGDSFHYGSMIVRMAHEYDAVFSRI